MDYRPSITDDEHPAGSSPWGSSPPASPRRNESTFGSLGSEPAFAYGASSEASNGLDHDALGTNAFANPGSPPPVSSTPGFGHPETPEPPLQSPFGGPSDQPGPQEPGTPAPEQQQQGGAQDQPSAAGAPGAQQEQQARRPAQPQYKLQAKITGLERTGRKDPILRFDVHVSRVCYLPGRCPPLTAPFIDEYPQVSNYTIPRCPSPPLRVH